MRTSRAASRAAPRLYLVTPPVAAAAEVEDALADALNAADIAAVLLQLAPGEERALIERVGALRILIQSNGAALLLDGHPELVARAEADGAHLTGIEAFQKAAAVLKPARIVGCGGLATRHDAMQAGESGADYVMFGEPDANGRRPVFDSVIERVEWWAEVFEVPCVACAADLDEAEALARAGADFVAIGETVWRDVRRVAEAAKRLVAEPVR